MTPTRKPPQQLTRLELQIMKVLWDIGPAAVQVVQERLSGEKLAYTTVQTMLNVLDRKGKVKRALRGKAYIYSPVLSREKASSQAVSDLVDRLFGGSVESLIMSLVKTRKLDAKKIQELKELVDARLTAGQEGDRGRD
jgi:BlaI family transcriptional regulator, penicillinase repressor